MSVTSLSRIALALPSLLLLPAALVGQEADYPTEPPPPLEARQVSFPEVGRDTLENGLELVVVENHEQPVVSVRLYTPAGTAAEPDDRTGVASLTASTLDQGTESRSAEEIASTVEGTGASLSTGASDDYGFVATSVLTERLPTVLDVFADVVRRPTFPREEVANQKKRTRSNLESQLSQPDALASRRFRSLIYGSHPYGEDPRPSDIDEIDRDDLVGFHESRYTPHGSMLVFAGDIGLERAREMARSRFGDWTGPEAGTTRFPEPPGADSLRVHLVHRPASAQSSIWVGHLGPEGDDADADRHAIDVLNRVLGGGPASRLFLILREERGWTYGASSRFTSPQGRGYFAASASVRPAVTDSTLREMLRQLRRIRGETVPDRELADAKSYLTGSFPLRLETPQQVASQVADVILRGLGIEYLERYRGRVSSVTADAVQEAARRHVHPDRATAVVVGDAREIHEDLAAIGPVTLWDTDFQRMQLADLEVGRSDVALQASRIRRGTFGYSFRLQGKPLGEMSMSVERTGGDDLRVSQELTGQVSRSSSYTVRSDLSPVSSTMEARLGPLSLGSDLEYDGTQVTGSATVPEQGGGGGGPSTREVTVDTTLAAGTLDGETNLAAVLASPLSEDFEMQVPVFSPGQGVNSLGVSVTGQQTVEVPAGSFETWVVELQGPQQTATVYVTREAPHLMVKQEISGQPVSVVLTDAGTGTGGSGPSR